MTAGRLRSVGGPSVVSVGRGRPETERFLPTEHTVGVVRPPPDTGATTDSPGSVLGGGISTGARVQSPYPMSRHPPPRGPAHLPRPQSEPGSPRDERYTRTRTHGGTRVRGVAMVPGRKGELS